MRRNRVTRIIAFMLIFAMLPLGGFSKARAEAIVQKVFTDESGNYEIVIDETSAWNSGYNAQVTINNTSSNKIKNWNISGKLDGQIENIWNAQLNKQSDSEIEISYQSYNRNIPKNGQVKFGMQVKNGDFNSISQLVLSEEKQNITEKCDVSYEIKNSWEKSAIIEATIHNTSEKLARDWKVAFTFDGSIDNIWNGDIIAQEEKQYVISNKEYNADIPAKGTVTFGFQVTYNKNAVGSVPTNNQLYIVTDPEKVEDSAQKIDWYKSLIQSDDDVVTKARDNVKNKVKVALLDSGVDYTNTINVEERINFVEDSSDEEIPLWDDLSGHGTGVAGLIVSNKAASIEETEEPEESEEETKGDTDFSFLTKQDAIDPIEEEEPLDPDAEYDVDDEEEEEEEIVTGDDEIMEEDESESVSEDAQENMETDEADSEEDGGSLFAINEKYGEIDGINRNISLSSVRVLDENNEAPVSRVIKGIQWAIDNNVNILHLSWGTEEDNEELHKIIKKAYKKGILIVAPAGNDGNVLYPAKYDEVMSVNSVNSEGRLAQASAFGEGVEVVAPGENITVYTSFGILTKQSGTSFAAPQVTALASILWQQDITKSNEFIRQLIDVTATSLGDEKMYGCGMINYKKAVEFYNEYEKIYNEKKSLEENEGELILEGKTDMLTADNVSVVDSGYVKGLWANHVEIAALHGNSLKKGISWSDNSKSKIQGKSSHPKFHGGNNCVSTYVHVMKKAKTYWNTGKWSWGKSNILDKNLKASLGQRYVDPKGNILAFDVSADTISASKAVAMSKNTKNKKIKKSVAQFVMGIALHTLGDIYAHKSYGLKEKVSYYGVEKSKYGNWKDYPNVYSNIMHGVEIDRIKGTEKGDKVLLSILNNNIKGKTYLDNRADCINIAANRYLYTQKLYKDIISQKINKSQKKDKMPSASDFIKASVPKFTTSIKQNARKKTIVNHFGIKGLANQLKDNGVDINNKKIKAKLECLDLTKLMEKFNEWKLVKVNIAKDIKVESIKVYRIKKDEKFATNKDVIKPELLVAEKEIDKIKYAQYGFLGDVGREYIVTVVGKDTDDKPVYSTIKINKLKKSTIKHVKRHITIHNVYSEVAYKTKDIPGAKKCDERYLYSACNVNIKAERFNKSVQFSGVVEGIEKVVNKKITKTVPLEGAKITVEYISSDLEFTKTATTNKKGKYVFKGKNNKLYPGVYKITVNKKGYKTEKGKIVVYSTDDDKNYRKVLLEKSSNSGKGSASGCITDAKTGQKVGGLQLNLIEGFGEKEGVIAQSVRVDKDGNYNISDIPSGYYTAQIVDNREVEESNRYLTGTMDVRILGNETLSDQNGVVTNSLNDNQLRIVLTWGETPSDLDSHLLGTTADGKREHMYYGHPTIKNSQGITEFMLDVDDTSSYGPETTTIYNPTDDDYNFYVYNFSRGSSEQLMNSGATVQVYKGASNFPWQTYYVPEEEGYCWNVFSYDAENEIITSYDEVTYSQPD